MQRFALLVVLVLTPPAAVSFAQELDAGSDPCTAVLQRARTLLGDAQEATGAQRIDDAGHALRALAEIVAGQEVCWQSRELADLLNVAAYMAKNLDDHELAAKLWAPSVGGLQPSVERDTAELLRRRGNLAVALLYSDQPEPALPHLRAVYREFSAEPASSNALLARDSLARAMRKLGDSESATWLHAENLRYLEQSGAERLSVLEAQRELAKSLVGAGDYYEAIKLWDRALAERKARTSDDGADLREIYVGLATANNRLGDARQAFLWEEKARRVQESVDSADPWVHKLEINQAISLSMMGDFPQAEQYAAAGVEGLRQCSGLEPSELVLAERILGTQQMRNGKFKDAAASLRRALEYHEADPRATADERPRLLELGVWIDALDGRSDEARGKIESILATEPVLASSMRALLLQILVFDDEEAEMTRHLLDHGEDFLARVQWSSRLSLHKSREQLEQTNRLLHTLLSCALFSDSPQAVDLGFSLVETFRDASARPLLSSRGLFGVSHDLIERHRELDSEVRELRLQSDEADLSMLLETAMKKEVVEAEIRAAAPVIQPLRKEAFSDLEPGVGLVGYRVYGYRDYGQGELGRVGDPHLMANVLTFDGRLVRIELGPMPKIREAVSAWRNAIGVVPDSKIGADEVRRTTGDALRRLVLDPVLSVASECSTLHVCLDDVLHMVPLDALPWQDGVLGQKVKIRTEASFSRLLEPDVDVTDEEPTLLLVGGVEFGSGARGNWRPLPKSLDEVKSVEAWFDARRSERVDPLSLSGSKARKTAFLKHASESTYIHVATHAAFADEPDTLSAGELADLPQPRTLSEMRCRLIFAGANEESKVETVLTGTELPLLDLSGCRMVVLSACDTNVGVRRSGQGIRSLQASVLAAGARTVITSLWKVPDEPTSKLMAIFYRQLWEKGLSPADALWEAKMEWRNSERRPEREWAGWVLTGAPE